jgi:hypothetical protein
MMNGVVMWDGEMVGESGVEVGCFLFHFERVDLVLLHGNGLIE